MIERIKKNEDFQKIYGTGQKKYGLYTVIIYKKENFLPSNRFGFVASKKIGNAVCRNRVRRIFREFVKNHSQEFPQSYSFIFIGKKTFGENIKKIKYEKIEKDLLKVLNKIEDYE